MRELALIFAILFIFVLLMFIVQRLRCNEVKERADIDRMIREECIRQNKQMIFDLEYLNKEKRDTIEVLKHQNQLMEKEINRLKGR